ncbi:MAG: hypothetical protein HQL49_08700 [Gammaproteobacteria bacterium]|nr:hypothetical protein [Gammaproteobacteria bacterium]
MKEKITLLMALLLLPLYGRAELVDIDVHNEALRLNYQSNTLSTMQGLSGEVGLLYHENDKNIFHLGFAVQGENWSNQGVFHIGMGGRLYISNPDNYSLYALGLGGWVRFSPMKRLGIGAQIYHAPDIIASGDADNFTEAAVRIDYQMIPQAFIYIGHRYIESDIKDRRFTLELEDQTHLGFRLLF